MIHVWFLALDPVVRRPSCSRPWDNTQTYMYIGCLFNRVIFKILLLVYKALWGLSPSYISSLLSFCSSSYSLRSCSNKLLQVPRSKLKCYGDRRFSIAGPKLWNSLPASLRKADSLNSFKKHLKTFISPSFFLIYY